ncbi:unnamed protein product [Zymoseptoria tritici ST99CH_3D1]|nr:unnamed protein product [Zymoseptoria tritici ST99CH_3D1]
MHFNLRAILGAYLAAAAVASPTPDLAARADAITSLEQLTSVITSFRNNGNPTDEAQARAIYERIVPQSSPSSMQEAVAGVKTITDANPGDIFKSGAEILLGGFAGGTYLNIINAYLFTGSSNNINLRQPFPPVYPKADPRDAPYSVSESKLRAAIYIPPGFTYGGKQPLLFLPGTGVRSGPSFASNMGKLFTNSPIADPVYVNIPNDVLGDIQIAAEYVAYAVNYISGISGNRKVSTLSWSAGSVSGQWALKYWYSNRDKVNDKIGISSDYHGTVFAKLLCPGFETPGCTPAIAQQNYNSTFIRTLRNNGGDSTYVPTTNVYSIFDEIVQPQADPNASAFLNGATNVELQSVCTPVLPGGAFYNEHAGVLFNSLAYSLAMDALTNPGSASLARVNAEQACAQFAAPGITLPDIFNTYAQLPIAALAIIAYQPKVADEPPIMPYAQKDVPA